MVRFVSPKAILKRSYAHDLFRAAKTFASLPQLLTGRQHLVFKEWNETFGDRYSVRLAGQRFVFLSDPESIQRCFELDEDYLDAGAARRRVMGFMPDNCLLFASGHRHRTMRKIVAQSVRVAGNAVSMESLMDRLLGPRQTIGSEKLTGNVQFIFSRAVSEFLVGRDDPALRDIITKMLPVIDNIATAALIFPSLRKVRPFEQGFAKVESAKHELNDLLERTMKGGATETSFMGQLLRHSSTGAISAEEVRDNVALFSLIMLRALKMIYKNVANALSSEPDWQYQLRTSIVLGHSSAKMIRATVKETLRMYPMVPLIARRAKKEFQIDDFEINANDLILITPFLMHFRDQSFAEPQRFVPRRFLGRRKYANEFLPFGGGKHHCIGSGWTVKVICEIFKRLLPTVEFTSDREHASLSDFSMRAMLLARRESNYQVREVTSVAKH